MPTWIGKNINRIDAEAKVTGKATFPGDFNLPNMCYMKVLFSRKAHAIIKDVDVSAAVQMQGVLLVLTAKDIPVNEYGLIFNDQPVLCGPGSTKAEANRVRFVGDQIALVVAENEEIAEKAANNIRVVFEDLQIVSDPLEAMKTGTVVLHPHFGSNIFCHYKIRKGDVEYAFDQADVIIESEYKTPAQEHAYLQPEAGIAYIDDRGRITVVVGGQWVHEDQEQIAHSLNLPAEMVRVIYPAIGGAFGGREDMSVQIILALAAWKLHQKGINRPVKIVWNREESIIGHHKRHPFKIRTRWGATRDGMITAAEVEMVADGGAYAYTSTKVLGNATILCTGPYEIPNVKVDSYAVYTNNVPGGAFRGFGGPQANFCAEMQVNKLAQALGLDPIEIRNKNLYKEGSLLPVGTPIPKGVTIRDVVAKCANIAGWYVNESSGQWSAPSQTNFKPSKPYMHKGIGFACGYKNIGFSFGAPEQCWATIELHGASKIEKVVLHHAGADVGQGAHTVFCQMAAEALDVNIEKIQLVVSDTAYTGNSGSASASRMTFMAGNAIRGAAQAALVKWDHEERPAIGTFQYRPPRTSPMDPETGKSEPNFAYGYVAEAVEVEVDTETGLISIGKVFCANDVGHAINPQLVEGQIEGAIVQAAGYSVLENFIQEHGIVLTDKLSTYLIPTIMDIPHAIQSIILEHPDPIGPWGARGMGEMPYLPFASALISAVHDATGIWFDEFPLTPERVLKGLGRL